MILGVSGHRNLTGQDYKRSFEELKILCQELNPEKIISGMAIGFDFLACEVALKLKIPYLAAVPFQGQELFWPRETQNYYRKLLDQAESIEIVNRGCFANWKFQARNEYIVNHCHHLVALLRSSVQFGGTVNCVSYAKSKKKIISIIDPDQFKEKS